ncbi:hypothetical protein ACFYWS_20455 [Streptomyces sp. NPDC002795]|uniref:hypothetical protein n=1 Tax=Streptomyces sp. NPDC002795 TaxID=3364665 RepID=UPI00368D730C
MANDLPEDLIRLQREADEEGRKIAGLDDEGRAAQRTKWFDAAAIAQASVTAYAEEQGLSRYQVEKQLRQAVRHPQPDKGTPQG